MSGASRPLPAGLRVGSGLLLSVRELYCLQPRPDRLCLHLSRALPTLPSHAEMHRSTAEMSLRSYVAYQDLEHFASRLPIAIAIPHPQPITQVQESSGYCSIDDTMHVRVSAWWCADILQQQTNGRTRRRARND